jgi:hypothetical protein
VFYIYIYIYIVEKTKVGGPFKDFKCRFFLKRANISLVFRKTRSGQHKCKGSILKSHERCKSLAREDTSTPEAPWKWTCKRKGGYNRHFSLFLPTLAAPNYKEWAFLKNKRRGGSGAQPLFIFFLQYFHFGISLPS